jgi:hypothetical protein
MRNLNPNERRLLFILLAAGLLIGNLLLLRTLSGFLSSKRSEIQTLRIQLAENERWIGQGPFWLARSEWVALNPPEPYRNQTEHVFFNQAKQDVAKFGLEIPETPPPTLKLENRGGFAEVSVTFPELTGTLEDLIRWMTNLQQPGKYTTVRSFTLKSAADPTRVEATDVILSHLFTTRSAGNSE